MPLILYYVDVLGLEHHKYTAIIHNCKNIGKKITACGKRLYIKNLIWIVLVPLYDL